MSLITRGGPAKMTFVSLAADGTPNGRPYMVDVKSFNFQATSSRQGADFEHICNDVLSCRVSLRGKMNVTTVGVEVDQHFTHKGKHVWIEYKGSTRGKRPGLIRTDSMKKAIANGALTKAIRPGEFWVVTSHLPTGGASMSMMMEAQRQGFVDKFMLATDLTYALGFW